MTDPIDHPEDHRHAAEIIAALTPRLRSELLLNMGYRAEEIHLHYPVSLDQSMQEDTPIDPFDRHIPPVPFEIEAREAELQAMTHREMMAERQKKFEAAGLNEADFDIPIDPDKKDMVGALNELALRGAKIDRVFSSPRMLDDPESLLFSLTVLYQRSNSPQNLRKLKNPELAKKIEARTEDIVTYIVANHLPAYTALREANPRLSDPGVVDILLRHSALQLAEREHRTHSRTPDNKLFAELTKPPEIRIRGEGRAG